jgi:hypothetical protein
VLRFIFTNTDILKIQLSEKPNNVVYTVYVKANHCACLYYICVEVIYAAPDSEDEAWVNWRKYYPVKLIAPDFLARGAIASLYMSFGSIIVAMCIFAALV